MPSGVKHENVNVAVITITLCASIYFLHDTSWLIHMIAIHLFALWGTFYLNPDCDLSRSRPVKNWGGFKWIVLLYSGLNPHRGMSHVFVIGTLLRVIYIIIAFSLIFIAFISVFFLIAGLLNFNSYKIIIPIINLIVPHWMYGADFIIGLIYSDGIHIFLDKK